MVFFIFEWVSDTEMHAVNPVLPTCSVSVPFGSFADRVKTEAESRPRTIFFLLCH